jgi:hypothetical protein
MYGDKMSLAAGYRWADTYCHDRRSVPHPVPPGALVMITFIVMASGFVLFVAFGALVLRDVCRQTAGWPEHRWTDADDIQVARLVDAGRR